MIVFNGYPVKLTVNGKDLSHCLMEINVSNTGMDFSGLVKTTGSIKLDSTLYSVSQEANRNFFDARINGSFWKRGTTVKIEVANNVGAYRLFDRGTLKLSGLPVFDYGDDTVDIPVYCDLCNFDVSAPDEKFTRIKLGTDRARVDAVNIFFQSVGITSQVTNMPFPLKWNINTVGGSPVTTCGQLAFECGDAIYIDRDGIAKSFYFLGVNKNLDIDVANDAIEYEMTKCVNLEFDKLMITAEIIDVKKWEPPPPIVTETFDIQGTKIGITRTTYINQYEYLVEIQTTRGLAFPKQYPNGDNTLFISETIDYKETYQDGPNGAKLERIEEERTKAKGMIAPEIDPGSTTPVDAYKRVEEFVYNSDDIVITYRQEIEECKGIVYPDDPTMKPSDPNNPTFGSPYDLTYSYILSKKFEKDKGDWVVTTGGMDFKQSRQLAEKRKKEDPPQTKRRPLEFYKESSIGTSLTIIAGSSGKRIKYLQVNAVDSTTLLNRVSQAHLQILKTNNIINRITLPYPFWTDQTQYYPYFHCNVKETYLDGTSKTFRYMSDAHSFHLGRDQHTVSMDLLYVGEV